MSSFKNLKTAGITIETRMGPTFLVQCPKTKSSLFVSHPKLLFYNKNNYLQQQL